MIRFALAAFALILAAGVPSTESHIILDAIDTLPEHIGVLIIEHDMEVVFRFAERITVMVEGVILTEGTPESIAADEQVRAVYLGQETHGATHGRGHRAGAQREGPYEAAP